MIKFDETQLLTGAARQAQFPSARARGGPGAGVWPMFIDMLGVCTRLVLQLSKPASASMSPRASGWRWASDCRGCGYGCECG